MSEHDDQPTVGIPGEATPPTPPDPFAPPASGATISFEKPSGGAPTREQPLYGSAPGYGSAPSHGEAPGDGQAPAYGQPQQAHAQPQQPYGQTPGYGQQAGAGAAGAYAGGAYPPAGYPASGYPASGYPASSYPGGFAPLAPTSGRATAVLVLGIVSLIMMVACAGFIPAIIAVCLAPGARREIQESGGRIVGEGQVRAGKIMSWITLGLSLLITLAIVGLTALGVAGGSSSGSGY